MRSEGEKSQHKFRKYLRVTFFPIINRYLIKVTLASSSSSFDVKSYLKNVDHKQNHIH